jgi:hypothetical protein
VALALAATVQGAAAPSPPAPPSAACHVTDGAWTVCADGSREWADVPARHFPETSSYLYADQADLDPELAGPRTPHDTFVLMYDECGRRTPLGPDEYLLVTFDTVEVEDGKEVIERYAIHIFDDGTIVFLENGEPEHDEQGRLRVREIEGQRGDAGFGPSPECPFDHVFAEFEIKLTATGLELDGGYSPDPLFWSAEPPNRPPVARDDAEKLEDGAASVTVPVLGNDSDPDGTIVPSTLAVASPPEKGTASVSGGAIVYTPGDDFEDGDAFTYTVQDDDGAQSNAARVEITSCPTGRTYPVTLPPVVATLNFLKPWVVSYDALPLTFTTQPPPAPAYCSARSSAGSLTVRVTCRLGPPLSPCPFPPFIPVPVASSTATATLDLYKAEDAPVVPVCDWTVVRTGCLLNAGGGGTYVRWTTSGFDIRDPTGFLSYNTGPHTFWANLTALAPANASLGAKIQAAETFFHVTLIRHLSSIDRLAIVQDPPAGVLVRDPSGRRSGKTAAGSLLDEIPAARYFESGDASALIVPNPQVGSWSARATGEPGTEYELELAVVDLFAPESAWPAVTSFQPAPRTLPASGEGPEFFFSVPERGSAAANMIANGRVQLGVNPAGHLNVPDGPPSAGSGTPWVGLRFVPTGNEATAPGCLCEGWGVADATSGAAGWANEDEGGARNLGVESFQRGEDSAVSTVRLGDRLRVTHDYHPSASPDLFEATVTIENTSASPVDLRYRRVMDWDVEPTPFDEFVTVVTVQGTERAENVLFSSDDGFATANPLGPRSRILFEGDAVDSGPADHGALFDFGFGEVEPGESVSFRIYYGASATEAEADAALAAVRAEVYSYGQPNTPGGAALGTPNTFVFAFSGVGGEPVAPPDGDADGVLDELDNCPFDANPSQADANLNGLGDACETAGLLHNTAGFLQALLDGTTTAEPTSLFVAGEPSLAERLARIVVFRLDAGLATDAEVLARNLVESLVDAGLVAPGDADALVQDVLRRLDSTPPETTATVTPAPNAAGWNATPVEVVLSARDDEGGSGVESITYSATGAQTVPPTTVPGDRAVVPVSAEGVTTISYAARDRRGNVEETRSLVVRVDRTAPQLSCSPSPRELWPPNHKLVDVTVTVALADEGAGPAGFVLLEASSSEPDDAGGDGNTTGDVAGFDVGTPDTSGWLRAERQGGGPGRVYTLRYGGADRAGHEAACAAHVVVPHDRGG